MLNYKHPGVYTQEVPSGVRTITGAPTSVAMFVGPTPTGIDLRPIRVQSFADFERNCGGLSQTSNLSYSVLHFFSNGGGEAFVLRVPPKGADAASSTIKRDTAAGDKSIALTALSSGAASNGIFVEIDPFGLDAKPYTADHDKKRFNLTIIDRLTGRVERFTNLSTSSSSARFAKTVVNDEGTGSKLAKLEVIGIDVTGPQANGTIYKLKALPAAATFSNAAKANVKVAVRKDDGSAEELFTLADVQVFAKDEATPKSVLEVATHLANAANQAIRGDATATEKMEGLAVESAIFEGGAFIRLTVSRPGDKTPSKRRSDATLTLLDPTGPATDGFPSLFLDGEQVANPSRYQLGAPYTGPVVAAPTKPGRDGEPNGQPDSDALKNAVTGLGERDPFFNLLCLPDVVRAKADDPNALHHQNAGSIYVEAAKVCKDKHAFLLIDPFPNIIGVGEAESWKTTGLTFQSSHSAAFFPNIRVDDPLVAGAIRSHPPSGAIAGVIARTDGQFGVWQAPAGVEASLSGVYGPSVVLSDKDHGILNPLGLNCIRQFPIYGTVNFGSRTVDGSNAMASEWKYIPVRRTANHILRTLSESLRWAVHKPNGEQLWSQLRMNVTAFMHGMFRQGAFKGVSAREAYFVQCDASTTTADDINQGIVNIIIGFAPLKPAEFVVISLRQIVQPLV